MTSGRSDHPELCSHSKDFGFVLGKTENHGKMLSCEKKISQAVLCRTGSEIAGELQEDMTASSQRCWRGQGSCGKGTEAALNSGYLRTHGWFARGR